MTIILAILAGIAGAAAGWFASSLLYYAIALGLGASDMEGGLAMGAVFAIGPLGAVLGAVAGAGFVIYSRRGKDGANSLKAAIVTLAVISAAAYGGFSWMNSGTYQPQFPERGPKPVLNFEIDVADAGWPAPADYDGKIELHTFDRFIYPDRIEQNHDDGMHRISGHITLLHKYDRRQFAYWISKSEVHYFELKLGEVPEAQASFGDWFVADRIGSRLTGTSKKADASSPVRMRTKITWE
ncbi:MAG: hypothetical protein AB3N20_06320 [Rhizobiaceae bacterium]